MDLEQLKAGLVAFLDNELMPKITGWRQLVTGAALAAYLDNSAEVFNKIKENPAVQALGIIDDGDNIDIEKIYKYFYQQAKKKAVTFKAPIIGDVTLRADDIEKLYDYIMKS